MYDSPRVFIISHHELIEPKGKVFLWHIYTQFKRLVEPKTKFHDNIVIMYQSDYEELYRNQK